MADLADSCVPLDLDEKVMRFPITSEKPTDFASPSVISSSVPEVAEIGDEELKKVDQFHGEVLETPWKLISCGNKSSENESIEQEVSRYQTCNRVTTLQGDKNDADYARSNDRCGMHEHLLFDILPWLPVVSLLRIKSICKFWCSLIDSSTFITQHLYHNCSNDCLLACHEVISGDGYGHSKFCLLSGNKYEVYSNLDYKHHWCSVDKISILNSCNGIVCLLNDETSNAALWNPATKQLRPLPDLQSPEEIEIYFGFGFDVKSNDYKVVRFLYSDENKHNNQVAVYSMRTDFWRIIHKDVVLPFGTIDYDMATCKNGTCFWTGYAHDKFSSILISFDWNDEIFETMSLPGEQHDPDHHIYAYNDYTSIYKLYANALDLVNDRLCYIKGVNLDSSANCHIYFEIWVLDEYGVKSWNKICKFGPTGCSTLGSIYVIGFTKNGEFLLLGSTGRLGELYLSDLDARVLDVPPVVECFHLQKPNPSLCRFVHYNESLVSLKREDGT